jgi:hypothetical protein
MTQSGHHVHFIAAMRKPSSFLTWIKFQIAVHLLSSVADFSESRIALYQCSRHYGKGGEGNHR